MKKSLILLLLCFVLLAGCSKKVANAIKVTKESTTTTSSAQLTSQSTTTEEIKQQTAASTSTEVAQETAKPVTPKVTVKEPIKPKEPISDKEETTIQPELITTEEEAVQQVYLTIPGLIGNEDIIYQVFSKLEDDFIVKISSKSMQENGGSGTVGFYRVTPNGDVTLVSADGTPAS